jgi:beta-lactamase class A
MACTNRARIAIGEDGFSRTGREVNVERRTFVVGGSVALLVGTPRRAAHAGADAQIAEVESQLGGRLGVVAVDTANGVRIVHRGSERFAMCSTFKWMLATAVLAKVKEGGATLDQRLFFAPSDLLAHSPVTTLGLCVKPRWRKATTRPRTLY